jgi:N-acetylmuramoyl-L-alanine amidase
LFPWYALAQEGLGSWPSPAPQDFAPASEDEIAGSLDTIGYDTTSLPAALRAFQSRYFPENLTGIADKETAARIRALEWTLMKWSKNSRIVTPAKARI